VVSSSISTKLLNFGACANKLGVIFGSESIAAVNLAFMGDRVLAGLTGRGFPGDLALECSSTFDDALSLDDIFTFFALRALRVTRMKQGELSKA
jgi:hypothetical protein